MAKYYHVDINSAYPYVMTLISDSKLIKRKNTKTSYDFSFIMDDMGCYGNKEVFISPRKHEGIEEIIKTINHESLHACLDYLEEDQIEFKEHFIINKIQWIDEYV